MTTAVRTDDGLVALFSQAIRICRANYQVLVPLAFIGALANAAAWLYRLEISDSISSRMLLGILSYFASAFVHASLVHASGALLTTGHAVPRSSVAAAARRYRQLMTTEISTLVLTLFSAVFIPYFYVRWWFTSQAVMLDGDAGWDARDRSASCTRGEWWRVFFVIVIVFAVQYIAPRVVGGVLPAESGAGIWIGALFVAEAVVAPFAAVVQTLLYFDLANTKRLYE